MQGVSYRSWAVKKARQFGLNGWIRNKRDGTVEALVSGPKEKVNEILEVFYVGPINSSVVEILQTPDSPPDTVGFIRRPTV